MSENLRECVEQAISGDQKAIAALYRSSFNSSYFLSYYLLGDEKNAQGVVCESFIEVFSSLKNLKNPNAFSAYVKYVTAKITARRSAPSITMLFMLLRSNFI